MNEIGEGFIIDSGLCETMQDAREQFDIYLGIFNYEHKGIKMIRSEYTDSECDFNLMKYVFRKVMRVYFVADQPDEWINLTDSDYEKQTFPGFALAAAI